MERALTIAKIAALSSLTLAGLFLCYLALQGSWAMERITNSSTGTLAGFNTALETINRPCSSPGHIQPCGTLAEVNKLATHTSDLIVQSQIAVKHADQVSLMETAMLPEWNRRFTQTLGNVDTLTATANASVTELTHSASKTMDAATTTISAVQPVLASANAVVSHADAVVASPQIPVILESSQDIVEQAAIITHDAKVEEQKYVYPPKTPWYKKIVPTVLRSGELAYDFIR